MSESRARLVVVASLYACLAGCAHAPRPAAPAAAVLSPLVRMEAADRALAAGCFDCLVTAFRAYDALREHAAVRDAATDALIRTGALIAVRENELGLLPGGYLDRARQVLDATPERARSVDLPDLLEMAAAVAAGPPGQLRAATSDPQLSAVIELTRNQARWAASLRRHVPDDLASSYLWLSLACGSYGASIPDRDDRRAVLGPAVETTLIAFKEAAFCVRGEPERLEAVLGAEPRFHEVHYFLGQSALGTIVRGGVSLRPDLDKADREFRRAYEWRQDWPTLTLAMANVALTAEDFARAFEFYDKTLALAPLHPDALVGRIRALTYLGRAPDAIAATDVLLMTGVNPGEARYWRAFNEARLRQDDDAWADVEIAEKLIVNAEVPKLAGSIALSRRELDVAQAKLELARSRNPKDCEVLFYLQSVLGEQRQWEEAARMAEAAAACFDAEETTRRGEIASLRASDMAEDRRERQIARREQQLAQNARMRVNAWFNAAAAQFNLGRVDDARRFAERLIDDPQFGERAQELLRRLMP